MQVKNYLKTPWTYPKVEQWDGMTFQVGGAGQ